MLVAVAVAAQCPPTTGASISACSGAAPSTCGFPGYACARSDANTQVVNSLTTVPPDAGANHCVAGSLQTCGNLTGLNHVINDPAYNGTGTSHIVRISDYSDLTATPPCGAQVGQGGAAAYNVFDSFDTSDSYLLIACTGGTTKMKWLNPSTGEVVTTGDPHGYVHTASGVWSLATAEVRAAYTAPGTFFYVSGSTIEKFTVTSGIAAAATAVADFKNGIPCWGATACPAWQASHTYVPGSNIVAAGHNWQDLNMGGNCTSGLAPPNWAAGIALATATAQGVVNDGSCSWFDNWIPPVSPIWAAGFSGSRDDKIFNLAMSNHSGQDSAGACFQVNYDLTTDQYHHLNTCTGNLYDTASNGTITYAGNIFLLTSNPWTGGRDARVVMHSSFMSMNGRWTAVGFNNCAQIDSGGPLNCNQPILNAYYWIIGTSRVLNSFDWFGTGTPGHSVLGHNVLAYKNQNDFNPHAYPGLSLPASGNIGGTLHQWFDVSAMNCQPNACWMAYSSTNPAMSWTFMWDQHSSWQSNQGADNTPICTETYGQSSPAGGQPLAEAWLWPPHYAWIGEVICYATDGSNHVAREAYVWNTQTSPDFNSTFNIGSMSADGKWWAFNSDWFCSLGSKTGTATSMCALPFQANHTYAVGELVAAPLYNSVLPDVYRVTTAGTSDGVQHGRPFWAACASSGCTLTVGTVGLTWEGASNQLSSVFIVKLQ